jgi:hypothetical protein
MQVIIKKHTCEFTLNLNKKIFNQISFFNIYLINNYNKNFTINNINHKESLLFKEKNKYKNPIKIDKIFNNNIKDNILIKTQKFHFSRNSKDWLNRHTSDQFVKKSLEVNIINLLKI